MTDREVMLHRFCRANLRKSTGELAKYLGLSRQEYEDAVRRGMKEESDQLAKQCAIKKLEKFAQARILN